MTPEEWRNAVGAHVERRRLQRRHASVRAAARSAGFTESVWRSIESGKRQLAPGMVVTPTPSRRVTLLMAEALGWPENWLDRLLAGDDPATFPNVDVLPPAATTVTAGELGIVKGDRPVTRAEFDALTARVEALERDTDNVVELPNQRIRNITGRSRAAKSPED